MSEVKRIGVAEAKRTFADLLGSVRYKGERYIVERNGTPMAAIVPVEDATEDPIAEERKGQGFLGLIGAFDDAPEYAEILNQIVRERASETTRPVPDLEM